MSCCERYLGDGVYVECEDEDRIKLTTRNGIITTNTIYLDLEVASGLLAYINEHMVDNDKLEGQEFEPPVYTRLLTDEEMEVLKNGITYDFDKEEK